MSLLSICAWTFRKSYDKKHFLNLHGLEVNFLLEPFNGLTFQETLWKPWSIPVSFPGGSVVKNLPANIGDMSLISGLERSPGEGNGHPLQYSCLGNPTAEEPGGLQSMGLQRVGHDFSTKQQQWQCIPIATSYQESWWSYSSHCLFYDYNHLVVVVQLLSCVWLFAAS